MTKTASILIMMLLIMPMAAIAASSDNELALAYGVTYQASLRQDIQQEPVQDSRDNTPMLIIILILIGLFYMNRNNNGGK